MICGLSATMIVYLDGDGPGTPMCTRHGDMLVEDTAGLTWSSLRPRDGDRGPCGFVIRQETAEASGS
jgi:hypothetical protein